MEKQNRAKIKALFREIDRKTLAADLNSSVRTIDQYANGLLGVSALRAKQIERATNGKVPAAALRPDIFGD